MLFIFEGPDSVGKSTISEDFARKLASYSNKVEYFTFPGRDEGTLGHAVYRLHHAPSELGVSRITSTSLQILHIAAHVDAIESRILPSLDSGSTVVLDRFWWSTLVYGIVTGANMTSLEAMINLERLSWRGVSPCVSFLVQRELPFKLRSDELLDKWHQLNHEYQHLADKEATTGRVVRLLNNTTLDQTVHTALEVAMKYLL